MISQRYKTRSSNAVVMTSSPMVSAHSFGDLLVVIINEVFFMKGVDKMKLRKNIEAGLNDNNFNLYAFIESYA